MSDEKTKKADQEIEAVDEKKPKKEKERMYTSAEVKAMLKQVADEAGQRSEEAKENTDRKKLRLARIEGQLIVGFKNRNEDEFLPGIVIHAFNKWNNEAKQNEAWVEVVFENGKTKEMPLLYLVSTARPMVVEIVKENVKDESYSIGQVEKTIYDESGGTMKGSGIMVQQKVEKYSKTFDVLLPTGEQITVPDYIINMV